MSRVRNERGRGEPGICRSSLHRPPDYARPGHIPETLLEPKPRPRVEAPVRGGGCVALSRDPVSR